MKNILILLSFALTTLCNVSFAQESDETSQPSHQLTAIIDLPADITGQDFTNVIAPALLSYSYESNFGSTELICTVEAENYFYTLKQNAKIDKLFVPVELCAINAEFRKLNHKRLWHSTRINNKHNLAHYSHSSMPDGIDTVSQIRYTCLKLCSVS